MRKVKSSTVVFPVNVSSRRCLLAVRRGYGKKEQPQHFFRALGETIKCVSNFILNCSTYLPAVAICCRFLFRCCNSVVYFLLLFLREAQDRGHL